MMTEEENILIERYLSGQLSRQELEDFENRCIEDVRFRESVLLQKQLSESLNEEDWSFAENVDPVAVKGYEAAFRSAETKELSGLLKKVNKEYQSAKTDKKQKPQTWYFYVAAAVISLVIALTVLLPGKKDLQELYAANFDLEELPTFVVRGEQMSALSDAQRLFEGARYDEALRVFEKQMPVVNQQRATLYIYKGISEMQLENYKEARTTFLQLSKSNLMDASKGLWYIAVLEMKRGDKEALSTALKKVVSSPTNYKFNQAKSLLDEL